MAFTVADITDWRKGVTQQNRGVDGDDWKSLIQDKVRQDEASIAHDFITQRKKKEDYKSVLDQQNKYISNLKNSKRKLKKQTNMAERMRLCDQYNQENDLMIQKRLKSVDRLKKINDDNKLLNQMRAQQTSLEGRKQDGDTFKENPIEYRLRTDFLNKKIQNRQQERDILAYNHQAARQLKMKQEHRKEKDKYYGKQFDAFVENQAATYLLNRTSQQGKYETKRQIQDLHVLKERTTRIKNKLDEAIAKHKENGSHSSSEMEELLQMERVLKKCLLDIEKADKVQPQDPNSMTREVSYKTNIILDWQIHDKKINEIEAKLNDKEYKNYLQLQADNEIHNMNEEMKIKRERQNIYHTELQNQEKHQKMLKRNLDLKLSDRERLLNKCNIGSNNYSEKEEKCKSVERFANIGANRTIDATDLNKSGQEYTRQSNSMARYGLTGRKHKNNIQVANQSIDHLGNLLDRSKSTVLKKLQQKTIGMNSRMSGIQNIQINNNNSTEMMYPSLTKRNIPEQELTDKTKKTTMPRIHSSLEISNAPAKASPPIQSNYSRNKMVNLNLNTINMPNTQNPPAVYSNFQHYSQHLGHKKYSMHSKIPMRQDLSLNLPKSHDFFNPITGGML
ncbi:unnamed protein product [Moneuplotes crassus]|uniref:Uncharacterized protein n=1 Tax=Euplotes crassus TaxID=5936 RepID=A0AAD1U3I3_EUPCR|nr:unnamed protein product [Moneuplotes crassus]